MNEELTLLSPPHLYPEGYPRHFTIKTITAELRLETIGAENLDQFIVDEIFPKCVIPTDSQTCDYKSLLLIDFHWICRALHIVSWGATHFVNAIACTGGENNFGCKDSDEMGRVFGDHRVSLSNIGFRQPPANCEKILEIKAADTFIDWKWDLSIRFPRVGDMLHARKDPTFRAIAVKKAKGEGYIDPWDDLIVQFAYAITHCNKKAVEDRRELYTGLAAMNDLDFDGLLTAYNKTFGGYGIEMSGTVPCPKCGAEARFYAPVEERFLRPSLREKRLRREELIKAKKSKQPLTDSDVNTNRLADAGEESEAVAV